VWLDQRPAAPAPAPPGNRPPRRGAGHRVRSFVHRHGWRAYALPILIVITIVALASATGPKHSSGGSHPLATRGSSAAANVTPEAPRSNTVKVDPGDGAEALPGDALPPGPKYTQEGKGTFTILNGTSSTVGHGRLVTYALEVENGVSGVNLGQFESMIVNTLSDTRSWTGGGTVALRRVDSAKAQVRIALTSSMTVRQICGYAQKIETSCRQQWHGHNLVVLNVARWVRGDVQFGQDLTAYRHYMINHEFGHALGHNHSYVCLPNGLAPVMMQQTITLKENQGSGPKICQPNSWPYPPGVNKRDAVTT
jgi:Protein of unknown function (DUF3152)